MPSDRLDEAAGAAAFAAGDYARAYRLAESDDLRGSCLIMMGCPEDGLALIGPDPAPHGLFTSALAMWGTGARRAPIDALDRIPASDDLYPAATRLKAIVASPRFHLILQGREDPGSPSYDLAGALRECRLVDLTTVGITPASDIVAGPSEGFDDVIARLGRRSPPHAWLCHLFEDHFPPLGIERAPFPTLFHTQDYDRHFHHCFSLMSLFDGGIVLGSVDHRDIANFMKGGRAFVFPFLLGVGSDFEGLDQANIRKEFDVYVSGSLFNHNDGKSRTLFLVSQLPAHYKVVFKDGYEDEATYHRALRAARCTVTYVARWGLINGRAVEAIANGCCALYQEGGELGLFLAEEDGAVPYGPDNVVEKVREVVDNFEQRHAHRLVEAAAKVRRVFDFKRAMHNYVVALAGYTALVGKRAKLVDPQAVELRYANRSPQRIPYFFGRSQKALYEYREEIRRLYDGRKGYQAMDAKAESLLYGSLKSRRIDAVFESDLPGDADAPGRDWLAEAERVYRALALAYPGRIAARFNLARVLRRQGKTREALAEFERVLEDRELVYEATDSLCWREFDDEFFDYDLLMRMCVEHRRDLRDEHIVRITNAIRESALSYLLAAGDALPRSARERYFDLIPSFGPSLPALALYGLEAGISLGRTAEAAAMICRYFELKPWTLSQVGQSVLELCSRHNVRFEGLTNLELKCLRLRVRTLPIAPPATIVQIAAPVPSRVRLITRISRSVFRSPLVRPLKSALKEVLGQHRYERLWRMVRRAGLN